MVINKVAQAGTSETSDTLIMVSPNPEGGIKLELDGKKVLLKLFGKQIEKVIRDTITEVGVEDIVVNAKYNGALDYTIRARVKAAIERAI